MTDAMHVAVNNEWMRRYIEQPEQFARDWQTIQEFLAETSDGREPSYGERCLGYTELLLGELFPVG